MCDKCQGTHVVHEVGSFGIMVSCCPVCGPISDEEYQARLEKERERLRKAKEEVELQC